MSLLRRILRKALSLELYEGKLPLFIMPKFDNKRLRYLSLSEADLLLSSLREETQLWHDITLFDLQTGLRANEIFSLKRCHVHFRDKILYVMDPKNKTNRSVPLNAVATEILQCYLPERQEDLFFTNNGIPISEAGTPFRRVVKKCGFNAGITDRRNRVVFHTLRHTFASWLVQNGTPLMVVGDILGHKSITMTQRYAHLAPSQALKAVHNLPTLAGDGKR